MSEKGLEFNAVLKDAQEKGSGHKYLIQHSAGSGKHPATYK